MLNLVRVMAGGRGERDEGVGSIPDACVAFLMA